MSFDQQMIFRQNAVVFMLAVFALVAVVMIAVGALLGRWYLHWSSWRAARAQEARQAAEAFEEGLQKVRRIEAEEAFRRRAEGIPAAPKHKPKPRGPAPGGWA